ncbi:hypothetical protein Ciccas_001408 [Cichlidogyrus casuarinus]|uniref:WW domain-containing protein n=1 Tax=Cichlidogyrus casuarinus TaxID=1844966 RepID=A0ABD2QK21_9PLAT
MERKASRESVITYSPFADTSLDKMFNVVKKGNPHPLAQRGLPDKFFNSPMNASHSRTASSPECFSNVNTHNIFLDFECEKLPEGYGMDISEGKVYFLHHASKSTSWFDPRIPKEIQNASGMTLTELQEIHRKYAVCLPLDDIESSASGAKTLTCIATNLPRTISNRPNQNNLLAQQHRRSTSLSSKAPLNLTGQHIRGSSASGNFIQIDPGIYTSAINNNNNIPPPQHSMTSMMGKPPQNANHVRSASNPLSMPISNLAFRVPQQSRNPQNLSGDTTGSTTSIDSSFGAQQVRSYGYTPSVSHPLRYPSPTPCPRAGGQHKKMHSLGGIEPVPDNRLKTNHSISSSHLADGFCSLQLGQANSSPGSNGGYYGAADASPNGLHLHTHVMLADGNQDMSPDYNLLFDSSPSVEQEPVHPVLGKQSVMPMSMFDGQSTELMDHQSTGHQHQDSMDSGVAVACLSGGFGSTNSSTANSTLCMPAGPLSVDCRTGPLGTILDPTTTPFGESSAEAVCLFTSCLNATWIDKFLQIKADRE